ncbi:MAG: hypothetical protein A2X35_11760 [Elusimicrobia bacterium GWA2_61_42]|nr:MAG: hypothetical protein A2X35_11760 [Elusimicrobia bacterium GWA2_61_42]OGR75790.1 MAG: hypothetical protein A2X38_07160 [Elusimicrobia bacterium GWC2_61_25]
MDFTDKYGIGKYDEMLTKQRRRIVESFCQNAPMTIGLKASFGVGKTATGLTMVKALHCEAPSGQRPCGLCAACLDVEKRIKGSPSADLSFLSGTIWGGRIWNSPRLTSASMDEVEEMLFSYGGAPKVYFFDEFHRASIAVQERFLKILDARLRTSMLFAFATEHEHRITKPLLERFHICHLNPPAAVELIALVARVCATEDIEVLAPAAQMLLVRGSGRNPRLILKALQILAFDGSPLSEETVQGALEVLKTVDNGREKSDEGQL